MGKGYSLVELLVVLAIMAALIGVILMGALTFLDRAKGRAMQAEKAVVIKAIKAYLTLGDSEGGTAIAPHLGPDAVRIDPQAVDAPPFAPYLDAPTKYYYVWDEGGENLRVYERADRSGKSF